jgi:O-antigen ligase
MQCFGIRGFVTGQQISGIFGNTDDASCMLAVALPAFLRSGKWRWIWIPILGLALAKSWIGVVAAAAILLILSVSIRHLKFKLLVIVIALAALLAFGCVIKPFNLSHQRSDRLSIWNTTISSATVKAWTGWGFGQYDKVIPLLCSTKYIQAKDREGVVRAIRDKVSFFVAVDKIAKGNIIEYFDGPEQRPDQYGEAHNDYLEWGFVAGVPFLCVLLLAVIVSLLRAAYQTEREFLSSTAVPFYGLIASCICAMFFFSWQLMPVQALTVFYLGVIHGGKYV